MNVNCFTFSTSEPEAMYTCVPLEAWDGTEAVEQSDPRRQENNMIVNCFTISSSEL